MLSIKAINPNSFAENISFEGKKTRKERKQEALKAERAAQREQQAATRNFALDKDVFQPTSKKSLDAPSAETKRSLKAELKEIKKYYQAQIGACIKSPDETESVADLLAEYDTAVVKAVLKDKYCK